jgi:integrase
MATFRWRGDYQWKVEIRRKGWPYQTRTFESKADAEKWARLVEGEMDKGIFVDRSEAESTSLKEAFNRYLREVTPTKKGAEQEKALIGKLLRHPLASRSLAGVRSVDIANLRDKLLVDLSASTVQKHLAVISHLYNVAAKDWGIGVTNPVTMVRKPKIGNARTRRMKDDEEQYLMDALGSPGDGAGHRANLWIRPMVVLAMETAMRQGEMLKMEWKDVDLESRTLLLHDTKNGENRGVPLSGKAIGMLQSIPRSIGGRVFPTTQSAVKQSWARAVGRARRNYLVDCEKTGIAPNPQFLEDLHFHDLRHEATSRLFESGKFEIMEVASITGHKTLQMLKRYTHLRASDLAKKMG